MRLAGAGINFAVFRRLVGPLRFVPFLEAKAATVVDKLLHSFESSCFD
jgi:hypothetical protein